MMSRSERIPIIRPKSETITATADTSVEEAGHVMLEHGFRHLPVVEGERAIGIVSIRDLIEQQLKAS